MDRDVEEVTRLCEDLYSYVRRQCIEKCIELRGDNDCGCNIALIDLVDICLASMGVEVEPWCE